MKKYIGFEEKELDYLVNRIRDKINEVSGKLVMTAQQLDGERINVESNDMRSAYIMLQDALKNLNEIYNINELPSFEEARKNLEKIMKEDIY